jgi:uncharacterized membrane protein HdeD (DUF308 family)
MKKLLNCYYEYTVIPAILLMCVFGIICGVAPLFLFSAPALTLGNLLGVLLLFLGVMTVEDVFTFRKTRNVTIG